MGEKNSALVPRPSIDPYPLPATEVTVQAEKGDDDPKSPVALRTVEASDRYKTPGEDANVIPPPRVENCTLVPVPSTYPLDVPEQMPASVPNVELNRRRRQ